MRGKKRSALHRTLGRPQQTGQPYANVPAWTLDRVHGGNDRPEGTASPEAWRLHVMLCDRLDEQGHDLTVAKLAEWMGCSPGTARTRLHELESLGWVVVRRTSGGWMHVQAIADDGLVGVNDEVTGVPDDSDTPSNSEESPLQESRSHPLQNLRSPYETPSEEFSLEDVSLPLAVGVHLDVTREDRTADAERKINPRPKGAPSVMAALPLAWQMRMTLDERERVLTAIEDEMSTGRTVAEMVARVHRRLGHWHGHEVRRPVAAALTVVRRGYDCPRPDCEDHLLPSGHPCGACAEIGTEVNRGRREALAADVEDQVEPVEPVGESSSAPPVRLVNEQVGEPSEPNEEYLAVRARLGRRRPA